MPKLRAGRGAYGTVLTKYIRPHQIVPRAGHRSDVVLLDEEEDGNYTFFLQVDNDSGNENAQLLCASSRFVKIVREGDPSLLFDKDQEPNIPWAKSEAKKLLSEDLISGVVPLESKFDDNTNTMTLKDIYLMRPEYADYSYKKFSARLRSLRGTISANKKRADADKEAFDTFVYNNPISYHDKFGNIQWQGSESQRLLKEDIRLGVMDRFNSKKEFWMSRPAYHGNFGLKQFRDKIKQEIGTAKYIHTLREKGKQYTYNYNR